MNYNGWKIARLEEVCEFQKGYAFKSKDYQKNGRRIIKVSNLNNYNIDLHECVCIEESKANDYLQYMLKENDVIITTVGSWPSNPNSVVGKVIIVQQEAEKSLLNQNAVRVSGLSDVDQKYLYYTLKNKDFSNYIVGKAQGAANQASITQYDIKNYEFKLPTIQEQKNIAATLSCLDNKIEINNRINKNLERIIQAIFKSWFVDFEPFQDDDFEESEFGMIPKGWKVVEMGDVVEEIRDKAIDRELQVLSAVKTGNLILSEEYFTKQVFSKSISKYVIVKPFEFAYNPARINIGSIGMNEYDYDGCVSPVYVAFRSENNYKWFMKRLFKTERFNTEVNTRASGSVRQTLNYNEFARIKLIYPTSDIVDRFNEIIENFYEIQKKMSVEANALISIRDLLLPKLMNGEIQIPLKEVQ